MDNSAACCNNSQGSMTICNMAIPNKDNAIVYLWTIAQHAAIIAARANRDQPWAEKWESDWIGGKYKGHYLL